MSKRVILTDDDLQVINTALDLLEDKSIGLNPKVWPENAIAARQRFKRIRKKLKSQHPRSVETLGLSGHGDNTIIPEIYYLCINNDLVLTNEQAMALQEVIEKAKLEGRLEENLDWLTVLSPSMDYNTADNDDFNKRATELKQELSKLQEEQK